MTAATDSPAGIWYPPPRVVIRLDFTDRGRVGPGKIMLLEQIAHTGSIAQAARALGMSYPRALTLLAQLDATLGEPAVIRTAGGAHGGGTALTPPGNNLVNRYRAIEAAAQLGADAA
jgi:molybdate transport system regulatory protein